MISKKKFFVPEAMEIEGQYFLVNKIINKFMQHGRKTIIERVIELLRIHIKIDWRYFPQKTISWSLEQLKPLLTIFSKRIGKRYYFVPTPLQNNRPIIISLKWLKQNVRATGLPKAFQERIVYEFAYLFFNSRNSLIQRRNTYYEIIYDNRSHMRFRWK